MLGTLDLNVIGLTFNIVGIFFLANSIKFKRSRRVVQEFFGVEKMFPLKTIKEHVVRKIQVYLGFLFLFAGYGIQIAAIITENASRQDTANMIQPNLLTMAVILVFCVVVITVILKIVEIGWTRVTFKRLLIDFFREHEWELVKNSDIAKEMGELLKIPRDKDDAIEDYIYKIKMALHIKHSSESPPAPVRRERVDKGLLPSKTGGPLVHRATPPRIE